jgi:hypothetical protein
VKLRRGPAVKAVGGGGGETPREHKPRRAAASGRPFTRLLEVPDLHREKSLEGAPASAFRAGHGENVGKAPGLERVRRLCEGKKP